ncbi:MAG: VapC toxin family PIN domain ribonuclease [Acidobacteria bacterium]|nr:VapC toxin family PIN domain ribonuclease [Acidobacteriota bacterium]MBV9625122.1 VapC toxin family PIN domain ribonuclease [Acidobacteriota bacterium]
MTQPYRLILADTNIWVDHFVADNKELKQLLQHNQVVMHPYIVTELALGSLRNRVETITMLESLPELPLAEVGEVLELIAVRSLHGKGIGFVDAHLLASLLIAALPVEIWTDDKILADNARNLGVLATPPFIQ